MICTEQKLPDACCGYDNALSSSRQTGDHGRGISGPGRHAPDQVRVADREDHGFRRAQGRREPRHLWNARMARANEYRAKAWECLSVAEMMNDPEERAEMLRFARMWMMLADPIEEMRGSYEPSPRRSLPRPFARRR